MRSMLRMNHMPIFRTVQVCIALGILTLPGCRQFGDFGAGKKEDTSASAAAANPNQVILPLFTPAAGSYNATQSVAAASATAGATICYTTDGVTTPTCNAATGTCITGTTYAANISVPASQTLMAVACKAGMINSIVSSAIYTIDSTAPTISLTAPTTSTYVTNAQVSYTTNEACGTGSITWTRTAGTADPGSPRVQALTGAELTSGTHTAVTLANNPALIDGATYSLTFNCSDAAGNAATASTVTGVTYDGAVPVISGIGPANGSFMNTTQVSYTLSENCNTGNVTWTRTGGTADPGSPRVQAMSAAEKLAGAHNNITLGSAPALVSGTVYSISFDCTDLAGQAATTQTNTSITFDNVLPVISAVSPATSTFVNNTQVSYTLSETCNTGAITWAQTGGNADVGAPHTKALTPGELTAGAHTAITITNNPTLVSGAIYTLTFTCLDASGNAATAITRTNVTYDNTSVVISAVAPASSAYVNNTQVSYTLSETCTTGSITWTRTGGTADPGSPRVQALTGVELNVGAHTAITLTNNPALVDGTVYTVQFDCTDAAANAATPVTVTAVTYDVTVPVISGVAPLASTFVNHQQVTYTLSETCATGTVNWTYTGGTASGSFNQGLIAGELTVGVHGPFTISNNPVLVSGAVYTVTFSCTDLAGNVATSISRTSVTFDNTPPTITLSNLRNNSPLNTGFAIGTAADNVGLTIVDVSLDAGGYTAATGTTTWKFALPSAGATWLDRSSHAIVARAQDAAGNITMTTSISVRKGTNQDINGDGYPDVAAGGWKYNPAAAVQTGRAYVFYGGPAGIASIGAGSAGAYITGEAANNNFSRNIAMGDFNGDGFADLAVAAYGYASSQGRVYIFNGSAGAGITGNLTAASASRIITGNVASDSFGSVIITGNANNDGYTDLIVGANGYTASTGRVYAFYGGAGGITQTTAATASVTITGEASSQFGGSLALGDFNNDGFGDLAVGAPFYSASAGRAYIFYGSGPGLPGGTAGMVTAIATGTLTDAYGGSIAAGDINADGATDLVVGAYGFSSNSGKAYVYYGVTGSGIALSNGGVAGANFVGTNASAFFTTSVAIADVNADGFGDLMVGSYGCTVNPAGCAYIFYGQGSVWTSGPATLAGYQATGTTGGDNFGRAVGATDANGDGYPDFMVGANLRNSGITSQGAGYIFNSSASGPGISVAASANTILIGEAPAAGGTEFAINFFR